MADRHASTKRNRSEQQRLVDSALLGAVIVIGLLSISVAISAGPAAALIVLVFGGGLLLVLGPFSWSEPGAGRTTRERRQR